MNSVPLYIKVLIAILISMLIISINDIFAGKDTHNNTVTEAEYEQFSKDVEFGLSQTDLLVKVPPIPFSEVDEIRRVARDKKDEYLAFESENKMASELSHLMASGYSMLERALNEYKTNKRDAEVDYKQAVKSFNDVLRILNKIHNNVI